MLPVQWVKTRLHDHSNVVLLSMIVVMAAWGMALMVPSHNVICTPFITDPALRVPFGMLSIALAVFGVFSLTIRSLPTRAVCLVCISMMLGILAFRYLQLDRYSADFFVYVVLTLQSWWAIFMLPTKDMGARRYGRQ